jgi:hypothetical protein
VQQPAFIPAFYKPAFYQPPSVASQPTVFFQQQQPMMSPSFMQPVDTPTARVDINTIFSPVIYTFT